MHIATPCLSASPCRQNRRCLPKAFFERILQERWRGQVTSCISRHPALAPALAVKIDAAYRRYFLPCLSASPCRQNRRCLPKAFFERILQERWRGQVTSCISRHPALAPALAVKIDAAPFQKFDPPSQTSYCNLPNWAQQERPLLPVDS